MGTRKCCVKECTSEEGNEGITFHRFPQTNHENAEKWIKACKFESNFKPTKHSFVCSQHFRRENFTILQSGKIILKNHTIPSIFSWNKDSVVVTKSTISISSDGESPDKKKKTDNSKNDLKPSEKSKESESITLKKEETTPTKSEDTSKTQSSKKKNSNVKKKEPPKTPVSPEKPKKSSKRLSAKLQQSEIQLKKAKIEDKLSSSLSSTDSKSKDLTKVTESPLQSTPKKKNLIVNFIPGNTIEAQNFDGKWISVKIIEVDTDEREVLVRSCDKNNKSKAGINDEWISMDSPRLRPAQPTMTFEVGEKVLARWNDCRKFPATIKRVLENDSYDVLFDDGYPKIVRGIHIHKYSAKNAPKVQTIEPPVVINPLLLNPPSLIPDYIKEMKDLPKAPTEGEWCCVWVDDIPVGEESTFDGTHGKVPSIIIPDWRVKEGWQKHIYLRQNGKWDVLFISPTNRRLRFKNELKAYLNEIGEVFDPEVWDFSLHKKRSKALDLCIQSDKLKNQVLSSSFEVKTEPTGDGSSVYNNPFANLGALPYVQPNLVQAAPIQSEISVGSLKVKVINNNYHCPAEICDKTFRKENHLQIHIKHYHEDLAKLMGECPNMEDLAYLRTTVDEAEITLVKSNRKSGLVKEKPKIKNELIDSFKEPMVKLEKLSPDIKSIPLRSPILEEALKKAPLMSNLSTPIKQERDDMKFDLTPNSLRSFDPETLIPPHAVSRPHLKTHTRRKMKLRFNPKPKKHGNKKRQFDFYQNGEGSSAVEGVIPYNEGPYFKNQQQSSYIDENGEVIKIVRMKKEEIINCICGFGEEDGLMIQCELCLCWQHGICHGIEKSNQVPEKHVCLICKNPYRQRSSRRFFHDQDWLYDGKLPISNYHVQNPKQAARFDTLKSCHTLIGNLIEMKKFMNTLDVKMNIAENIEHPKMYLWAKKWEQSPPRDKNSSDSDKKDDIKQEIDFEEEIKIQSVAPEPEAAIEPRKCQQNLLDHIQNQQNAVKLRLDNIENEINALEEEGSTKIPNGKKSIDDATLKQTLYMLINDLKQMNDFSDIHRNPVEESQ